MTTPSRNPLSATLPLLEESFRWFGPADPVPLAHIRQAGAQSVYTSLHDIPYGETWSREAIRTRISLLEEAGLTWAAAESVPVHEDIKTGGPRRDEYLKNYAQSLANLGAQGVRTVIYNFMPVLDWVRTDMNRILPDGSSCLHYDPARFAAFDAFALKRPGAEKDFSEAQLRRGQAFWESLDEAGRTAFINSIIDVFPGCKWGLSLDDIRTMLAKYDGIGPAQLKANLKYFLDAVAPAAQAAGVRLAIHPDDPPFPVLGLPRILSTAQDVDDLLAMAPSPANGLCFCAGSFSARADNDLPLMVRKFADRIHAVHLRVTRREADGSFYEDNHLEGSADMPAVMEALLEEQHRRRAAGRADWQLSFRPDHGHTMMGEAAPMLPGYSRIGRMRGLAELRGLQLGLARAKWGKSPVKNHS